MEVLEIITTVEIQIMNQKVLGVIQQIQMCVGNIASVLVGIIFLMSLIIDPVILMRLGSTRIYAQNLAPKRFPASYHFEA